MTINRSTILLFIIIIVGFFLRVHRLDTSPLRGDEAFTVQYWMMVPLSETITQQLTVDPQPFLAYAAYNYWGRIVGTGNVFAIRFLPAIIGTLIIASAYKLGYYIFRTYRVALITALMVAIQPFLIWHAQDVRNYALWVTFGLISAVAYWRATHSKRFAYWVWFIVFATIAAYLYYLQLFYFVAIGLYAVFAYRDNWRLTRNTFFSFAVIGLLLAPWYLQPALLSGGGYGGTTIGFNLATFIFDFPMLLFWGHATPDKYHTAILVFTLIFTSYSVVSLPRFLLRQSILIMLLALLPLVLLAGVSSRLNVFAPRYVLLSVPFFTLIFAGSQNYLRQISNLFLLVYIGLSLVTLWPLYDGSYTKTSDWLSLTDYLASHVSSNDLVIQAAADASFGYYYHYVSEVRADEQALPAAPEQAPDDIEQALSRASLSYDSVWLAAQGFTDWPNYGVVEQWLEAHMQLIIDTNTNGLRVQQYRNWTVTETLPETPLALFEDAAALMAIEPIGESQPTGELVLVSYWQPLNQTTTPLKLFVHLTSDQINPETGNPIWSQDDTFPQRGRISTQTWSTRSVYRDVFVLPQVESLPSNTYDIRVGFYNPDTGKRILTENGDEAYLVTTLTIE